MLVVMRSSRCVVEMHLIIALNLKTFWRMCRLPGIACCFNKGDELVTIILLSDNDQS